MKALGGHLSIIPCDYLEEGVDWSKKGKGGKGDERGSLVEILLHCEEYKIWGRFVPDPNEKCPTLNDPWFTQKKISLTTQIKY